MTTNEPISANQNQQHWMIFGCLCLGLIIGFMTGMSVSPTVTTVIGLIFAFTGGSVIVLIRGREPYELALMGKCLSSLALAVAIGVIIGVMARTNDWFNFGPSAYSHAPYYFREELTVDEIIDLYNTDGFDIAAIHTILQASDNTKRTQLTKEDLKKLIKAKVPVSVIRTMLTGNPIFEQQPSPLQHGSKGVLYGEEKSDDKSISPFEILEEKRKTR